MTTETLPHPTAEQIEKFVNDFAKSVGEPCAAEAIIAVNHMLNPNIEHPPGTPIITDPTIPNYFGVIFKSERLGKCTIHASCAWTTVPDLGDFKNVIMPRHTSSILMSLELRQTHRTVIHVE